MHRLLLKNLCKVSPHCSYKGLAEAMHSFLLAVRDAHGVVTRTLLTAYATTLAPAVQKNFLEIAELVETAFSGGGDGRMALLTGAFQVCFPGGISVHYPFHPSGVQQFVPADYQRKVTDYHALMHSMMGQRHYTRIG